jgi:predicted permease
MAAEAATPQECDLMERNPQHLPCSRIEAGLLPMLGVSPVLGRNFLPEEDRPNGPRVTLISYNVWLNRYNRDPSVLNRLIDVDGVPIRVVGVLPKDFALPTLHAADLIFPLARDVAAQRKMNPGAPVRAFARLKPGLTVEQAQQQMEPLFQQMREMIPGPIRNEFRLKVRSLRGRQMEEVRPVAWVLFGTVLAVLLIACANVASLMMARGATRQQELAVRSALGASRARLASQALLEAILLSFSGALAGLLFAEGLLRLFGGIAPAGIAFLPKAQLDLRIVVFTIVISVVCGLVFGLVSALQRPGMQMLTGRTLIGSSSARVRQWLVTGQIAMSVILLAIAMLLVRSFRLLENQKLGIRTDNALTLSITLGGYDYPTAESVMKFFQQLEERMKYGPGVSAVAMSDSLPPAQNHRSRRLNSIFVEGRPPLPEDSGLVTFRWVSPDYFRAMYIPIVQGEGFREEEVNSDEGHVVLSQTLANRLFPSRDAVGQRILLNGPESRGAVAAKGSSVEPEQWWTVVGVAADVKNGGLSGDELPEYYKLRRNRAGDWEGSGVWDRTGVLVLRSSLPTHVIAEWVRSQITAINPTLPVDIATMNQRVSKLADQPRFQTVLVGFFATSGLAMAVIGIYGVLAFLVAQREREIGVRMALGASRREILRLVMRRSLRLMVYGLAVGLALALIASGALAHMLFHIGPWDPASYLATIALLVIVGLLATWLPARSACNVDPAVALRAE